jgi:hypothetical protein
MCWTYLHLCSEHEVAPERARQVVINLIMYGLANESSPGQPERDG